MDNISEKYCNGCGKNITEKHYCIQCCKNVLHPDHSKAKYLSDRQKYARLCEECFNSLTLDLVKWEEEIL